MAIALMIVWLAVALFLLSRGPDVLWRWLASRPRSLEGRRGHVAAAAGLASFAGFFFVMGWLLVAVPGRSAPAIFDVQPAPAGLWQAGVALFVVGILVMVA